MQELPIHPNRSGGRTQDLDRRRDALGSNEAATASARSRLKETCVRETLRLTGDGHDAVQLARCHQALDRIEAQASSHPTPDLSLILEVQALVSPSGKGSLRTEDQAPQFRGARPSPARTVEARLVNLLDWLDAESGRKMSTAERMALWFARFVEIAPFDRGNFRTAHLLLSHFALADGYPFVHLTLEEADELRVEIEGAMAFVTEPLVTRLSAALSRSLTACEQAMERPRGS